MTDEKQFIGEAIDYSSISIDKINIVRAPCGSGKTTAALEIIPEKLGFSPKRGLFLTPLNSTKDELIYHERAESLTLEKLRKKGLKIQGEEVFVTDGDEEENAASNDLDKIKEQFQVMTYASFGIAIREMMINYNDYDCIICDEIHFLLKPLAIDRAKIIKENPKASEGLISMMMSTNSNAFAAINAIHLASSTGNTWVIGLTATPSSLSKIKMFSGAIQEVQLTNKVQAYTVQKMMSYKSIREMLTKPTPDTTKRLFYFMQVKEEKEAVKVLEGEGREAIALWGLSHSEEMTQKQLDTRDYLIKNGKFPETLQDLVINNAYELGLNIIDEDVKEVYIHTGNKDSQIQVQGRIRHDLELVAVYDREGADKDKRRERETETKSKEKEAYFNKVAKLIEDRKADFNFMIRKELTVDEKKELVKEFGCGKGWTTFKQVLEELDYGVVSVTKVIGGKRKTITYIVKPENNH